MTNWKQALLAAAIVAPSTLAATAAHAQVAGIAVVDPDAAVANSRAWAAAKTQINTTYKTQIDQAEARRAALSAEIQPLATAFDQARRAPGATDASLRPQATALQNREQAANAELQRLTTPVQRAQAYAIEQISNKLPDAVNAAVKAKNVSLLLRPQAAFYMQPTADITSTVTQQLDAMVPSVGITPPANWQPGQQGQAGAPAASAAAVAPAAATAPAAKRGKTR